MINRDQSRLIARERKNLNQSSRVMASAKRREDQIVLQRQSAARKPIS